MFFKGCQIVVVWRTSQWNLCKISLYRKWILSSERAKCVFSNFNKRTRYMGKLTTACFITRKGLSMSQIWAKSNFQLVSTVGRYLREAILKKLLDGVILLAWTPSSICILFFISLSAIFSDCQLLLLITSYAVSDCCFPSSSLASWLFWRKI